MYFVTNLASPFTIHPSALVINENKLLFFHEHITYELNLQNWDIRRVFKKYNFREGILSLDVKFIAKIINFFMKSM